MFFTKVAKLNSRIKKYIEVEVGERYKKLSKLLQLYVDVNNDTYYSYDSSFFFTVM